MIFYLIFYGLACFVYGLYFGTLTKEPPTIHLYQYVLTGVIIAYFFLMAVTYKKDK